ncbi:MAG: hypothetical protein AMXMBFR80_23150 [Dehalococcoidia bacterium]
MVARSWRDSFNLNTRTAWGWEWHGQIAGRRNQRANPQGPSMAPPAGTAGSHGPNTGCARSRAQLEDPPAPKALEQEEEVKTQGLRRGRG